MVSGSNANPGASKQLFAPRVEEFVPSIHHAGIFGSEGVPARVRSRARLLHGIQLKWMPRTARNPLPEDLQALLYNIVSIRLAWLGNRGIKVQVDKLRKEVLYSSPMFILHELVCNAFDAHVRANRQGRIGLNVYFSPAGKTVMDVSDDGIGFNSVVQGPNFIELSCPEIARNWSPFVEGKIGVGLLWSKFSTELHGGTLKFLRNVYPNQKTTVRLIFPTGVLKVVGS
jgi:hypothetical protein